MVRSRSLACRFAVVSLLTFGCVAFWSYAEPRQDSIEKKSQSKPGPGEGVYLKAHVDGEKDAPRLEVNWSIEQEDAILAISIQYTDDFSPREMLFGERVEFGFPLLIRRIGRIGHETLSWSESQLAEHFGSRQRVIKVWILTRVDVELRSGDTYVKGGVRTFHVMEVETDNAPSKLSYLCVGNKCSNQEKIFPELRPHVLEFELPDDFAGIRTTAPQRSVLGQVTLSVSPKGRESAPVGP